MTDADKNHLFQQELNKIEQDYSEYFKERKERGEKYELFRMIASFTSPETRLHHYNILDPLPEEIERRIEYAFYSIYPKPV